MPLRTVIRPFALTIALALAAAACGGWKWELIIH
jgi:hypothetical protein